MVILAGLKISRLNTRFPGHSKMNAEVLILRESEEHLFSVTLRTNQRFANNPFAQPSFVQVAEYVFARVQLNRGHLVSATDIPLIAVPFDLGQLGHGRRLLCNLRKHQRPITNH